MARSATVDQALARAYGDLIDNFSLHYADPGDAGDNEISGGSPTYARQPAAGYVDGLLPGVIVFGEITFDAPGGEITHLGLWGGGEFLDSAELNTVLSGQGQLKVTPSYTQSGAQA